MWGEINRKLFKIRQPTTEMDLYHKTLLQNSAQFVLMFFSANCKQQSMMVMTSIFKTN